MEFSLSTTLRMLALHSNFICSANCSYGLEECHPKVLFAGKEGFTRESMTSLMNLVLDLDKDNSAECVGLTDLFEPNQQPQMKIETRKFGKCNWIQF